jgi:hypothetical protein
MHDASVPLYEQNDEYLVEENAFWQKQNALVENAFWQKQNAF